MNPQDISSQLSNSPTGDSDILSILSAAQGQSPAVQQSVVSPTQVAAPDPAADIPKTPEEQLKELLNKQIQSTIKGGSRDQLRQILGTTDDQGNNIEGKGFGKFVHRAGNVFQAAMGRNFQAEADKQYQEKLQALGLGQKQVGADDLDAYREAMNKRLTDQGAQLAASKAAHEQTLKEVQASKDKTAAEALALKRIRTLSQNTTDAGNAETKRALAEYQMAHPNQNAATILKEFATDPETGELDPVKYVQMSALIKQAGVPLGTQRTNTPFQDANGNFGSKSTSLKVLPDVSLTGIQNRLGIAPGAAAAATPGFAGPGAPVGGGSPAPKPVIPVVPPTPPPSTGVSLNFDRSKFTDPVALAPFANNKVDYTLEQKRQAKEAADAGILHNKLRMSAASTESQTNNLARAFVTGDTSFQGPLANIFQGVRDYFGGVSPEESNQRIQDFRGLYDNLASSVKGAYRTVEIKDAHLVQGHTGMDPESTLALHAVNTLAQQKRMLVVGKALAGTGVTLKELDDIALATANKYLLEAKAQRDKSKNLPQALKANLQAPTLMPLDEAVNQYIAKKKMGLVKGNAPTSPSGVDPRLAEIDTLLGNKK